MRRSFWRSRWAIPTDLHSSFSPIWWNLNNLSSTRSQPRSSGNWRNISWFVSACDLLNELGHVVTPCHVMSCHPAQVTYDGFKVDTELDGDKEVTHANLTWPILNTSGSNIIYHHSFLHLHVCMCSLHIGIQYFSEIFIYVRWWSTRYATSLAWPPRSRAAWSWWGSTPSWRRTCRCWPRTPTPRRRKSRYWTVCRASR